jgi:F-type H+-transporting ATPase subunit delta
MTVTTRGPDQPPLVGEEALSGTADVSAQRVARVYAEALAVAADRKGQGALVLEELDSLVKDVFQAQPQLELLITGSAIGRKSKEEVIRKAFEGRASETVLNFLLVLNNHDRLELVRPVVAALKQIDDQKHGRVPVQVWTAVPLPDDQRERLLADLRQVLQAEPVLHPHVDPDLLGGLIIRAGDYVYDASVRTELETIQKQLIERSSHEIQTGRDRFCTDQ